MKKQTNYILIITAAVLLISLSLASFILPDRELSYNENRYLTQAPEFSVSDILEGRFESKLENYLSDQVIGRENWIRLTTGSMRALGAKDAKGVYLMDEGRLAERITPQDFKGDRFANNLKEITKLRDELTGKDIAIDTMLVPTAAYSYRNDYNFSTSFDEDEAMDMAQSLLGDMFIDIREDLSSDKGDFYYKTDHHWNYDGASAAAGIYIKKTSGETAPAYEPEELTDSFKGTLYSKVLLDEDVSDSIAVPEASLSKKLSLKIDEDKTYGSIYFMDRLENKDKYEVFFGGNYGKVDIKCLDEKSKGKPKLLIVKDSFANSFVPFILDDFSSITMVDTRYYRESVKDLAISGKYDRILILYCISNFSDEKMALTDNIIQ